MVKITHIDAASPCRLTINVKSVKELENLHKKVLKIKYGGRKFTITGIDPELKGKIGISLDSFFMTAAPELMVVEVWDKRRFSKALISSISFGTEAILRGEFKDGWFPLGFGKASLEIEWQVENILCAHKPGRDYDYDEYDTDEPPILNTALLLGSTEGENIKTVGLNAVDLIQMLLPKASREDVEMALKDKTTFHDALKHLTNEYFADDEHDDSFDGRGLEGQSDDTYKDFVMPSLDSLPQEPQAFDKPLTALSRSYGRRKVVCVGINYKYRPSLSLNGCCNDARDYIKFLRGQRFLTSSADLILLSDDQHNRRYIPTRRNILKALMWIRSGIMPGDRFVFQYSGHGYRLPNTQGTELDNFDEVLVPLDANINNDNSFIRDDLINLILVQSTPEGCRGTLFMDCCRSGTIADLPWTLGLDGKWMADISTNSPRADIVSFSGCLDSQMSVETVRNNVPCGLMSQTLFRILDRVPVITYRNLMDTLRRDLRFIQHDQIPNLQSSQKFDRSRRFDLFEIILNTNKPMCNMRGMKRSRGLGMPSELYAKLTSALGQNQDYIAELNEH